MGSIGDIKYSNTVSTFILSDFNVLDASNKQHKIYLKT